MRRWILGVAIIIALSGSITVYSDNLRVVASATGSVVAKRQSSLSFDLPGKIVEVAVVEGQQVEAGQLLARVDDTNQKFGLQQAEYTVQGAQAALNKLLEPVDARDVADAGANVKAAEGAYSAKAGAVSPSAIKAAQLQYQQALA